MLAHEWFAEPGWSYVHTVARPFRHVIARCTACVSPTSGGRVYRYVALVYPQCPTTCALADLGIAKYADVLKPVPTLLSPRLTVRQL